MELKFLKILIIEDESDFVDEIKSVVLEICRDPEFVIAGCKETATRAIELDFFDLIFLDLKIPSTTGSMDSDAQHGRNLLDVAIANAPGTPIFMLTGSSAEQFLPDMMALSQQVDIWGCGKPIPLIGFQPKHRFNGIDEKVRPYFQSFQTASEIELSTACDLDIATARLIKIFTNSVGGVFCRVSRIGGGLSEALVYKLQVDDGTGARIHESIAKIGPPSHIKDEVERHDRFISRLEAQATPRKVAVLSSGARATSGVFYSLATASDLNGFSYTEAGSSLIVEKIRNLLLRWTENAPQRRTTIGDIRRSFIADEAFSGISHLINHDWVEGFEKNQVQAKWGCVHGDLHGLNVLVSPGNVPVIIDYGDVGERPLSTDPITFELSVFFHPEGPLKGSEWPDRERSRLWGQSAFIDSSCPYSEFFTSCHAWAESVSVGKRERAAVAYSYLVRQLKYPGVDARRVNDLLDGAKSLYDIG